MMEPNVEKVVYEHGGMVLEFLDGGNGIVQNVLNTERDRKDVEAPIPYFNFQLGVLGVPRKLGPVPLNGMTSLPHEMKQESAIRTDDHLSIRYKHDGLGLAVTTEMHFVPGTSVIRQKTIVTNESEKPIVLTHLSSMLMNGIATDGLRPWQDPSKIKIHYVMQTWHGEGQWRSGGLEELGLYHASPHPPACTIRFSSLGSFSTAKYLPMVLIEDCETNKIWYFQMETSSSWNLEIGFRGSWDDASGSLYVHTDGGSERFGGWKKQLLPGETYTTIPTAFGCTNGNVNGAVRELTKYRRSFLKPKNAWDGEFPVTYNDFMNGIWGNPHRSKLIPLIDAAAQAGAECFCIDAGWFADDVDPMVYILGDWTIKEERFGDGGLQGVLDYIKAKGMTPGIWLEMEMASEGSDLALKPDDWFNMHGGVRVGGADRFFLNFTNPEVCDYLHSVIERLVAMGIGFIKNDYNDFIAIADNGSDNMSTDGLQANNESFYSFIDEVRRRHPRLILENCGSGGMREDNGVLAHFHIQSTSDQEIYHNYPSIIQGSLAGMLPEQAGIWAYPYPLLWHDKSKPDIIFSEAYQAQMRDGEMTIFNMVNGLCGNMYLAGHFHAADPMNMSLIQEAVELYKKERTHIHKGYPIYPTGFIPIKNKLTWASLGIVSPDNEKILLAVWRMNAPDNYFDIPLDEWLPGRAVVRQVYPSNGHESQFYYNDRTRMLTVHFKGTYQARYYEIVSI
ncbi:glycoside hydrolase family 36 protein [Paenibacillus roseipurpureus]|uniref:Alpha-galactosidase n=1 Tax=Paenibacillus roseopurpureus TaxID=2918901 RepID=A0AA96RKE5_9BACL|nr:alpha-galactosidase [Paenibacillus sp. MBLB1832]WNR46263.1 alpha-galactosidase [Paenibacillus sp. MBLB1832]